MNSLNQRLETVKPVLDHGLSDFDVALVNPTSDSPKNPPHRKKRAWLECKTCRPISG